MAILGWLIESITGEPLREHLRRAVLDSIGLQSTWIGMSPDQYRRLLPRLGVNVDMRNLGGFPMLFERSERVCKETNPAHGGYTSARDLAQFYTAVLTARDRQQAGLTLPASTVCSIVSRIARSAGPPNGVPSRRSVLRVRGP